MTSEVPPVVRVVVADRQPIFRRGLVEVLCDEPDLQVVGDTDDALALIDLVVSTKADVVLVDLAVHFDGIDVCAAIRQARPEAKVVVLARADHDSELAGAVRAGARGYLLKETSPQELLAAVRAVAAGSSLLSPAMASRLLDEFAVLVRRHDGVTDGAGTLSPREVEVLNLMAQGLNNRVIAEKLFISENTVKNHIRSIHEKLQVHSRMEAVVRAVREGLLHIT
ncbi:MAG: response regulator transcription factor [Actinomycetes bacterium]